MSQAACLRGECLRSGPLGRRKRERRFIVRECKERKRERPKAKGLGEDECWTVRDLALSQVCTTGVFKADGVYACMRLCVSVCRGVCMRMCGAAKPATCLSLVVVLVFPFIRTSAAELPLGAVSLLQCVCVRVCVCVAQASGGLKRLMFLKVHFALSSTFLYLSSLYFIETARVEAGSWPTGPQSRGGHQRKLLLQSQQEVMLQEKYCYWSIFN